MRDLCQVCRNFYVCPHGEGSKITPKVRQEEVVADKGEHLDCWEVVECDLFWEYPSKEA